MTTFHVDCIFAGQLTGVGKVALRILEQLNVASSISLLRNFDTWNVPTPKNQTVLIAELPKGKIFNLATDLEIVDFLQNLEWVPVPLNSFKCDILFFPFWRSTYRIAELEISLVHDLSSLYYPQHHAPSTNSRCFAEIANYYLNDYILVPSHQTKMDVVTFGETGSAELLLVPHGPSHRFDRSSNHDLTLLNPTNTELLYIGSLEPRKGVEDMLIWWKNLKKSDDAALHVIGDFTWWAGPEYVNTVRELLQSPGVIFHGFVDDAMVLTALRGATALIYPSIFEGFGLPVLDALIQELPVIAQPNSSLVDFEGAGITFIDFSLTYDLTELISDANRTLKMQRQELINRNYTWDKYRLLHMDWINR